MEKIIRVKSELRQLENAKEKLKETIKTAKEFIRNSIFTIEEEEP